jgi:uncharacterized membrane protein YfcA
VRPAAVFVGVFAGVLAVLLAAVGQLGKIDRQTLVAVLAASAVVAAIGAWRAAHR